MTSAAPEERRVVCVVFAQATGLADLPEAVRVATTDTLFLRLRTVIEHGGGTVDKFVGDVVMAVWGAPVAREDDPVRAVRGCLEMVREARAVAAELGLPFDLRVGANRGEVLYGSVGGDRPTVMGDPVNVAQRLQAAASPGQVLVSRALERLTHLSIPFARREALQLKGREEHVEVFEARDAVPGRTEVRLAPETATPLFGREVEMERLFSALSGGPAFLVVEGAPGAGKSRLLAEFRREMRGRAAAWQVFVGRSLAETRLPMLPFGEMIRARSGLPDTLQQDASLLAGRLRADLAAEPRATGVLVPLILGSLGHSIAGTPAADLPPERRGAETLHAWERWFVAISADRPVLLCVEDLHWADEATVGLLAHLASHARPGRLSVIATARPGSACPPGFASLPLAELGEDAARALAASVLGAPSGPGLARFLFEKTGGNPYYLEELARFLREHGLVSGSPLELTAAADRIPEGIHGLLVSRLDALGPHDRDVLKGASVLGRVFWEAILGVIAACDPSGALATARRREMVFPRDSSLVPGDREHVFKHALLRDAAYGLLTKKDRARLHARAAGEFEGRSVEGGRRVRVMAAAHREAAGEREMAASLWSNASEEALGEGSLAESLDHARAARRCGAGAPAALAAASALCGLARFDEALAELRGVELKGDERVRGRVLEAQAHGRRGRMEAALAAADEAVTAASGIRLTAVAVAARANVLHRLGRLEEADRIAWETLASFGPVPPGDRPTARSVAELEFAAGLMANLRGRLKEAREAYGRCLAARRALGDRAGIGHCLNGLANIHVHFREHDEARRGYDEALALARETGDRAAEAVALSNLATLDLQLGRTDGAVGRFREAQALWKDIGDMRHAATTTLNIGVVLGRTGDLAGALASVREARDAFLRLGDPVGAGAAGRAAGNFLCANGDPAAGITELNEAAERLRHAAAPDELAKTLQVIGEYTAESEKPAEAIAPLQEALALRRSLGDVSGMVFTLVWLADARRRLDERASALEFLAEAGELAAGARNPGLVEEVRRARESVLGGADGSDAASKA